MLATNSPQLAWLIGLPPVEVTSPVGPVSSVRWAARARYSLLVAFWKGIGCVIVTLALATGSHAESLRPIDPFAEMSEASIEIMVGDQTHPLGERPERLFGDRGSQGFSDRLHQEIADRLLRSGIGIGNSDTSGAIMVSVWGHRIPGASCGLDWVFSLDVSIWGPDVLSASGPTVGAGKVGAASDDQLEEILVTSVLATLDEHLRRRDSGSKTEPSRDQMQQELSTLQSGRLACPTNR